MSLGTAIWPEVAQHGTILVPLGATEQHGPHLPLETDTVIAEAVAQGLAPLIGASVAPAIPVGASGEHQDFPGTISVGTEVLTAMLVELGRSLTTWADRVIFVNAHGGNLEGLRAAVATLRAEQRDVVWVPCAAPGSDVHAGRTETSLMLHLAPASVRLRNAAAGNTTPISELLPVLRRNGVRAASANGVLGDPAEASAPEGEKLLRRMVSDAYHRVITAVTVA